MEIITETTRIRMTKLNDLCIDVVGDGIINGERIDFPVVKTLPFVGVQRDHMISFVGLQLTSPIGLMGSRFVFMLVILLFIASI